MVENINSHKHKLTSLYSFLVYVTTRGWSLSEHVSINALFSVYTERFYCREIGYLVGRLAYLLILRDVLTETLLFSHKALCI